MADTFTPNLNLRKPEVGAAIDSWGGPAGLNGDLDLLDAVFLATGLGTSVGLHVGTDKVLNVEGGITLKDPVDITKVAVLDRSLITTETTRTYQFPDEDGILVTQGYLHRTVPTGTVFSGYYGTTAPTGFVFLDGRTIGDATSGATNRANADTVNLFTVFWNRGFDPSGGRGASAALDFAAHKTMTLPDHSGRTMAGRDNLSGTARGVLTGYTGAGAVGGEQAHTLTVAEAAAHGHVLSDHTHNGPSNVSFALANAGTRYVGVQDIGSVFIGFGNTTGGLSGSYNTGSSGSGSAHNNIQPTIAVDVVIAL